MLTPEDALAGLVLLGLEVRRVGAAEWRATCPRCEDRLALRVLGREDGGIAGGCRWCGRMALVWLVGVLDPPDAAVFARRVQLARQAAAGLLAPVALGVAA